MACRGDRGGRVGEGRGDTEFRSVLFWVNLARKDKNVEPSAQVVQPEQIPVRHEGDAIVRVLVGRGLSRSSGDAGADPRHRVARRRGVHHTGPAGVPGLRLHAGGRGAFGANLRRAGHPQLVLLGRARSSVTDAAPGTRFMLMAASHTGRPRVQRAVRRLNDSRTVSRTPRRRASPGLHPTSLALLDRQRSRRAPQRSCGAADNGSPLERERMTSELPRASLPENVRFTLTYLLPSMLGGSRSRCRSGPRWRPGLTPGAVWPRWSV